MKAQIVAATSLLFALLVHARMTIYKGTGFGTYYYDVGQVHACGNNFGSQNTGPVECSLLTALSLGQINSEYLVAMNHSQLVEDMATYCGKRVIVSVDGVPSTLPLFIGDGCQRCGAGSASSDVWDPNEAPGLDFSYSVLSRLSANACIDGHISISWKIVDDTLYDFDTNDPGSREGPVAQRSGSRSTSFPTTATGSKPAQSNIRAPTLNITSTSEHSVAVTLASVARITATARSGSSTAHSGTSACPA